MLDASGEVAPLLPREPRVERIGTRREKHAVVPDLDVQVVETQLDGGSVLEGQKLAAAHACAPGSDEAEHSPSIPSALRATSAARHAPRVSAFATSAPCSSAISVIPH